MYKKFKTKILNILRKINRINEIISKNDEIIRKVDMALANFENLQRDIYDLKKLYEVNHNKFEQQLSESFEYVKSIQDSVHIVTRSIASNPESKIKIGFLVHNIEAWGSCEGIYYKALKNPHTEPIVFSCNRSYYGVEFKDEDIISNELDKLNIPHIRLNDKDSFKDLELMKATGINALFRQSHWQPDLPPAFQNSFLNFCNLYYISYEIASVPKFGLKFRYSFYEKLCKKVFLGSELIKKEHDELPGADKVTSIVTGHPKIVKILSAQPSWPIPTGNKIKIIWSAHHSYGTHWNNYGVFDHIYPTMLSLAENHPQWDFLFSPHPALLHRLQNEKNKEFSTNVETFFTSWNSLRNTGIIHAGDYAGAFKASNLLIIDGVSFLSEYQLNKKPIIQITRADTGEDSQFGDRVRRGVHKLPLIMIDNLENMINDILNEGDCLQSQQEVLIEELCEHKDPSQEILQSIIDDFHIGTNNSAQS